MNDQDFQWQGICDPLAVYAISGMPAWLWKADGKTILWANSVGVKLFGARNSRELAERIIGPADQHRRHVVQLAPRLPPAGAIRLERLRGFGAALGQLATCACSLIELGDGTNAVLIVGNEQSRRAVTLNERFAILLDSFTSPATAFSQDGNFLTANERAKQLPDFAVAIANVVIERASSPTQTDTDFGTMTLHSVGTGAETGWVGVISNVVVKPIAIEAMPIAAPVADEVKEPELIEATANEFLPEAETTKALIEAAHVAPESPVDPALVGDETGNHAFDEASPSLTEPFADDQPVAARTHPLRFQWQMDAEGYFSLGSDEFQRLIGVRTSTASGRLWSDLAAALNLDPDGRVSAAIATRNTWSGLVVKWPVDGPLARLPVELSGLPVYDRGRNFIGYRGFGLCRDLLGLARLAAQREEDALNGGPEVAVAAADKPQHDKTSAGDHAIVPDRGAVTMTETPPLEPEAERIMDSHLNVVPFRPTADPKAPSLSVSDNTTFNEIARQLSARLQSEDEKAEATPSSLEASTNAPKEVSTEIADAEVTFPAWLSPPGANVPRATSAQDAQLLERLPVGVLIYRLDRIVYGNRAFLERTGYATLHAFAEAGGLDALYVEPGVGGGDSSSDGGTPVVIAASPGGNGEPTDARLYSIVWDGDAALALIFSLPRVAHPLGAQSIVQAAAAVPAHAANHDLAEELSAILDMTAEGVLMFDGLGRINSCNRSAEALFGRDGADIAKSNLIDMFAPESQRAVLDYLQAVKSTGVASLLDHGRDVLGKASNGGSIPLSVTMGRTRPEGSRYFAVFRDLSQMHKTESELLKVRRLAERTSSAKSDMLGRISHDVRAPLNAIIGFTDVMIEERFGPLGNERYVEYMKDIRASGQRVISIIDDLLDLSRIESGKLDLAFTNQDLNHLVEQCVAAMQPQANRERIIIRTSLAHALPSVKADSRALKQIALNLIGNSIHLANAGGQVIVSTALTDFGDVALRIRDTGMGLNDNEIAAAMAPFRTPAANEVAASESGASLSLTKALVEANRAQFNIKTAPNNGTLIEVVFSHASAIA